MKECISFFIIACFLSYLYFVSRPGEVHRGKSAAFMSSCWDFAMPK